MFILEPGAWEDHRLDEGRLDAMRAAVMNALWQVAHTKGGVYGGSLAAAPNEGAGHKLGLAAAPVRTSEASSSMLDNRSGCMWLYDGACNWCAELFPWSCFAWNRGSWNLVWADYRSARNFKNEFDPSVFWADSIVMQRFPLHTVIARSYLAVILHEATCERSFSYTGRIKTKLRSSSSPDMFCASALWVAGEDI
jgi:hypothetical protein